MFLTIDIFDTRNNLGQYNFNKTQRQCGIDGKLQLYDCMDGIQF